jgi:hypothetical protein
LPSRERSWASTGRSGRSKRKPLAFGLAPAGERQRFCSQFVSFLDPEKFCAVAMAFASVVLAVIGLILVGVLPIWPFSRGWGYGPAVIIGLVLFILLVMTLTGRVPGMGELPRTRALRLGSVTGTTPKFGIRL